MDNIFLLKLLVSFFIGGLWIILATILADRFGSRIGGLISGLPSTVMFGLFFLAWTQTPSSAVTATTIIPIVGGINCLFLVCYIYFVKRDIWLSILLSLILWGTFSFILIFLKFNNYIVSILGYAFLLTVSFYLMEVVLKIKSVQGRKIKYTPLIILLRGLLGGFVVGFAVFLGKVGGPILGGMFSMFPAMFISTILVTYFSQGAIFSSATMKSTMLSGVSIVLYSVIVRYTYLPFGIYLGTLISILGSFLSGFLVYKLLISKLK